MTEIFPLLFQLSMIRYLYCSVIVFLYKEIHLTLPMIECWKVVDDAKYSYQNSVNCGIVSHHAFRRLVVVYNIYFGLQPR